MAEKRGFGAELGLIAGPELLILDFEVRFDTETHVMRFFGVQGSGWLENTVDIKAVIAWRVGRGPVISINWPSSVRIAKFWLVKWQIEMNYASIGQNSVLNIVNHFYY